jgi:excisionase family DNA binding protein
MVMEIVVIEKQAFERMKRSFENFTHQVKKLCENNQNKGEWLNSEEVCSLLHVSKRTLQKWRDEKIIPFFRIKGKILYRESDITAGLSTRAV